ncbi:MAG TPA: Hsp20/alpha crystallin family protein [Thermoanaerobaculia bacterium]|jgi:HSP20 family protein|nr:Hsp20/alpha crystallin family protein [Thermoanaerobaculia bacterium]
MLNNVTRWNPAAAAYLNREPFSRLFDTFFNDMQGEEVSNRSWVPPVDIQETTDGYRLIAELPGLTKDDISITLENNVLRLSGERKFEKDTNKESYHRIERTYGQFTRAFALPQQVNPEGVQAAFENGVLTITVPKAEQAKPRKIAIS